MGLASDVASDTVGRAAISPTLTMVLTTFVTTAIVDLRPATHRGGVDGKGAAMNN
jgi:hypothetical protein